VRVVVDLAGRPTGTTVRTAELARSTGVPRPYLAKVIQALVRAHLVGTRQGPAGGVFLVPDPATISLRAMIEAIEGRIYLNRCLRQPGECARDAFCTVHPVWARIQALLLRELDSVTARDLASGTKGILS
jgi:Rrf2 family protein